MGMPGPGKAGEAGGKRQNPCCQSLQKRASAHGQGDEVSLGLRLVLEVTLLRVLGPLEPQDLVLSVAKLF